MEYFLKPTSNKLVTCLHQALQKHPGDRPTIMEMLHHPWIHTYKRRTSTLVPVVRACFIRRTYFFIIWYDGDAASPLDPTAVPQTLVPAVRACATCGTIELLMDY